MAKGDNPFGIRKSPVEIIFAQALSLDDYVKRSCGKDNCANALGSCFRGRAY
jgi:hypothetical protein